MREKETTSEAMLERRGIPGEWWWWGKASVGGGGSWSP
ncbi:hypothetical protein Hamer_G008286 [Homarus americanus]|uniref:Uncharacterized protein n=1 Tax=Homarus americanus TaxID=6706 RepID=A0A8J5NCU3_HOMAM|nr:hypothetical protein Hamer_G008286 [Homarus americanus]